MKTMGDVMARGLLLIEESATLKQAAASREAFNGRFYQYDGTPLEW